MKAIAALSVRRHPGRTLKVLDFACSLGAIGACLRRSLLMRELYDYYGAVSGPTPSQPGCTGRCRWYPS